MPEELEKHLIFSSNSLRTFEDARLEVVTHLEAKFGLRIRASKPGARGHSDPMDVDAVNSLSRLAKEKGHQIRAMGVFCAVEHIFNETAMHAKAQASNRMTKANRARHGPRVSLHSQAKGKSKENKEKSKGIFKGNNSANQGAKGSHKDKTSKTGLSGLENSKSEVRHSGHCTDMSH